MKKLVLVCLIEAALAGYSVGAMAANIQDTIVGKDNSQTINSGETATGTTVVQGGSLFVDGGTLAGTTTVKNGAEITFGPESISGGLLVIEKGAAADIYNNDSTDINVTTNNLVKSGDVSVNHLRLAGELQIAPVWHVPDGYDEDSDESIFAPTPDKSGKPLITTIQTLEMQGGQIITAPYYPAAQPNRVEIGNLSGQGDFLLTTELANGWGDFINISKHATGNFGINVRDTGSDPVKVTDLNIVHVNSGDAAFRLTNKDQTVEVGTYQYSLKKKQDGEKTDWYLQGKRKGDKDTDTGTDNGNGDNGTTAPVLSYSAKGVMAMAAAPRQVLQAESVSLQQRLGNYYSNPQHGYGLWTRYLHDDTRLNDKLNTSFKNKLDGVQIGVDKPLRLDDATVLVGVFTGFSRTKVSTDNYGSGTVESYHGGLYATYLHDNGFYADGILKGNRLDNENNGRMKNGSSAHGDYHQNAFTATIESGFNYEVVPALTVQPYGKLQYARIGSADYELNNGMRADVHSADSLQGEAGTLISTSFDVNSAVLKPYARLAIVHEFTKENDVTINRTNTVSNDFSGSTGKYGLGLDAQITPQAAFYTEINYLNGNKTETPLRADVGFRVRF